MLNQYYWGSSEGLNAIQKAYSAGKAILVESDTVWGLLTPATAAGADLLDRIKKRRDKPYLVIMDSLETAKKVLIFPENGSYALAQKGWPGPLTLLCPAQEGCLIEAQSAVGVVGVRIPAHPFLRQLAAEYGGLFSTSANISGAVVPNTYDQITLSIKKAVGAIIQNVPEYKSSLLPSTIVDCTGPEMKVIRQGAYVVELEQ